MTWEPFVTTPPGENFLAFMEMVTQEMIAATAIPADFMRLHDHTLTPDERVMLELKIDLHSGWGLYSGRRAAQAERESRSSWP